MTLRRSSRQTRAGFTLVEILTVVSIIALLMSIMLPSLNHARNLARQSSTGKTIQALEAGLQMFHGDFDRYPDSSRRQDPITDYPTAGPNNMLSGAHWIARALSGYDSQGIDAPGHALDSTATLLWETLKTADRRDRYFDQDKVIVRDSDSRFAATTGHPSTGRQVIVDAFGNPILYYRAWPKAHDPANPIHSVYRGNDNTEITAWDFASKGRPHMIANPIRFEEYLHSPSVHEASDTIKAVKESTFVLISAGVDGVYGGLVPSHHPSHPDAEMCVPGDDVTNFR